MAAPLRSDNGIQTTQQASWTGASSVPGIYYQTGVGMRVRKPDNTEFTLGSGGGAATLTALYAAGASTSDSILLLDATRGPLVVRDNASPIGTIFSVANSSGLTFLSIVGSGQQFIRSGSADGASAVALKVDTFNAWSNATAKLLSLSTNNVEKWFWTPGGGMTGPANMVVTSASSATNTIGISHVANVADGASSVAHNFDNSTTLANAAASLLRVRNNGTTLLTTLLNNSDGVALVDGGGQSSLRLSTNAGTVLGYGGATYSAGSGSVTMADGTGSLNMSAGTLTGTVIKFVADADGTRDLGIVGTRWRTVAGKRLVRGSQSLSFSATPAFDATAGNFIDIGTITANVTGATMVSGSAGEGCTITFRKDATAGAYTIAFSGTNVRTAGTATFTTGSGSLVVLSFMWDDRLATPAWVERGRAIYN